MKLYPEAPVGEECRLIGRYKLAVQHADAAGRRKHNRQIAAAIRNENSQSPLSSDEEGR